MLTKLIRTGDDLAKVRERLGLTQAEMALALGYSSPTAYQAVERGRTTITPMLVRLVWMIEHHGVPEWTLT